MEVGGRKRREQVFQVTEYTDDCMDAGARATPGAIAEKSNECTQTLNSKTPSKISLSIFISYIF